MSATSSQTPDRELNFTRIFSAPRALVFKAWTDPEHIVNWWGPIGFTTTSLEMDFRVGGVWRYIMHGPDGRDYSNKLVYLEIVTPERIVYDHGDDDDQPPQFQMIATFEDQDGKTKLSMKMIFRTAEDRQRDIEEHGAEAGGHQTLGRLAEYLNTME